MKNNNENRYIFTNDNKIIINIIHDKGKMLLIKIIIFNNGKNNKTPMIFVIQNNNNINIRSIFLNICKKKLKYDINNKIFRKFLIINEWQYLNLTKNNNKLFN